MLPTAPLDGQYWQSTLLLFLLAAIRLLMTLAVALAKGFEEDYAGGYAYVEGFYGTGGGERHEEVATLAGQFVEAVAFAAHHDACGRRVIHIRITFFGGFIQAYQPVACFL